jgi:putative lipoprotein (rSAM/lipoprotein system)
MQTSKIIARLLTLLGFGAALAGCGKMYSPPPPDIIMYGVVPTQFEVKGRVTDADDKPLENIRVVLKLRDDETEENQNRQMLRDTVYTDANGRFETERRPEISLPWAVIASDIDGEENGGEFETEEQQLTVQTENFDNEEGAFINEVNFTLTEKTNENEDE